MAFAGLEKGVVPAAQWLGTVRIRRNSIVSQIGLVHSEHPSNTLDYERQKSMNILLDFPSVYYTSTACLNNVCCKLLKKQFDDDEPRQTWQYV